MALRRCNLDCRLHATHGRCRCAAAPGNPLGHCGTLHLQTIAGTVRHTIVGICAGLILIRITPPCRTASQSRSSIAAAPSLTFTPVAGHGGPANAALLPGWSRPAAVRARPCTGSALFSAPPSPHLGGSRSTAAEVGPEITKVHHMNQQPSLDRIVYGTWWQCSPFNCQNCNPRAYSGRNWTACGDVLSAARSLFLPSKHHLDLCIAANTGCCISAKMYCTPHKQHGSRRSEFWGAYRRCTSARVGSASLHWARAGCWRPGSWMRRGAAPWGAPPGPCRCPLPPP